MIIYKADNLITGKSYIGKTIRTLNQRKSEHVRRMLSVKTYFHNALNKYGLDSFKWQIVKKAKNELELIKLEKQYIVYYETKYPNGYNLTDGGDGVIGYVMTDQHKERLRQSKLGKKNPQYGKTPSIETRKKMSLIMKGRPGIKGRIPWNKGMKMKSPTKETIEKRRKASFKKYIFTSPNGIDVSCENGMIQFCKKHNIGHNSMNHYLAGRIKKTGSGWKIRYGEEN